MAKGMVTTLRTVMRPAFTERYPDVKKTLPERSRTSFSLPVAEDGTPKCKSCMLCVKNCPDDAIVIESEKREDSPGRMLTKFTIDLGLCMYCGLCVENCTSDGLRHSGNYETATAERSETVLVLYDVPAEGRPTPSAQAPSAANEEAVQ